MIAVGGIVIDFYADVNGLDGEMTPNERREAIDANQVSRLSQPQRRNGKSIHYRQHTKSVG